MMNRLSHPLLIILALFVVIGCSYTPKVAYDPILINSTPSSGTTAYAPRHGEAADLSENQGWSVITDPVVLDPEGIGYENGLAEAEAADIYIDYDDYSYSNFTTQSNDEINYRVSDYYYDTYVPDSYSPIRYVYSYYTPAYYTPYYRPFTWYYGEYVNHPYSSDYSAFADYYDPWRGSSYGAMYAYRDYPYYTTFYSGYGYYPGYSWSSLDYYNPFWTYSRHDYWGGYYASPYLYHHGYHPYYAYGRHWGRYGYPWHRYHGYDHDWDHKDKDNEKPPDGGGQREGRPMISQRNEEIRLTSSLAADGVETAENRSVVLPNLKSSRTNSLTSDRDSSTSETNRSPRRSIQREKERSIQVWSLPPLRTETLTQKTNPNYLRDQNMGQTIRTSRKDNDSSSNQTTPKMTQEAQRQSTFQSWNSQSPSSRISVWRNQRNLNPTQQTDQSRSTIVVQPSERRSNNLIRIYKPQSQTSRQRINSSNSGLNVYSADRSQQNKNSSSTRSFLQPIPRRSAPSPETPRTYTSPSLRAPASRSTTPSSQKRTYTIPRQTTQPRTTTSPSRSYQQSSSENTRSSSITIPRSQPQRNTSSYSNRINNTRTISPSSLSRQRSSSTYSAPARSTKSPSISIPRSSSSTSIRRSSVTPSRSISTPSRAPSRSISSPSRAPSRSISSPSRAPSRSISSPSRAPSRSISSPSRSPSRSAPASRSTSRSR